MQKRVFVRFGGFGGLQILVESFGSIFLWGLVRAGCL